MCDRWKLRALLFAVGLGGLCGGAAAQTSDPLPATTSLAASTGSAPPTQSTFTIAGPEDLVVTLTDLQQPQALTSLNVAITQGGTLAASYTLSSQTPSTTLKAANGTYTISVFGVPNASVGAGTFSVCVAPSSTPTSCLLPGAPALGGNVASFAGAISAQSAASNPALSATTFALVVSAAGNYTFNYTDLAFPVALSSSGTLTPNPNLGLFMGGTAITGGLAFSSGTSFSLSPGTYTLLAVALADSTAKAGSYGLTVSGPAGTAALLDTTVPVGQLNAPASVTNPAQQSLTLTVTDYAFPGALARASAMLTAGGSKLLSATSSGGPVTGTLPAGTLQVWNSAAAGTTAGTYGLDVASGTTNLALAAYGVAGSSSNYAYAFVTPSLSANTAYQAAAVDLQFPSQLTAISFAVAHDGVVTPQSGGGPTIDFTPAAARPAVVLVGATTPATGAMTGNGLFDVNVEIAGSSPLLVFDRTQAVSSNTAGFFATRTLSIDTAGNYNATLTDLQFPATFGNLALAVTQGAQIVGKIFGGGNFAFTATPGTYQLTFVATPQSTQEFGLYADSVTYAAPTVSLTPSATTVVTGSSITLNWTTTNATSCLASGGGFAGNITPGTGSQSVTVTATTTYMLQCSGPSGSGSASAIVTATPAGGGGGSGKSGGGALDAGALALWGLAVVVVARRRWRSARMHGRP